MIGRLTAMAAMGLLLAACEAKPPPAPASVAPPPKTPAQTVAYEATPSPTLEAVRRRGRVTCGVHPGLPGFAMRDARGIWRGFDVDVCRAVAAAVFGDAERVRFVPIDGSDRFRELRAERIDILSRNTSLTLSRDAGLGLTFPATTYYDGQGFLVARALGVASAEELGGARVCVQAGTASETNLADFFRARGLDYQPVLAKSEEDARRLYESDGCDVFSADISGLAASRSLLSNPNGHVILPNVISKEPLGPVVRQDDPAWADIVAWTVHAIVLAEELGLSSRTVEQARETATDPETRRLLGVEGNLGELLGVRRDWAYQVIRQVGAYHEIFRRDLGADSALKLERGLNALWTAPKPGLMYAPPVR